MPTASTKTVNPGAAISIVISDIHTRHHQREAKSIIQRTCAGLTVQPILYSNLHAEA